MIIGNSYLLIMIVLRHHLTMDDLIFRARLVLLLARKCQRFKIGKTGMTPANRRKEPDYVDEYPRIMVLYSSKSRKLVSLMEALLIDGFYNHPKSDNEKGGYESLSDSMSQTAKKFYVYMVCK